MPEKVDLNVDTPEKGDGTKAEQKVGTALDTLARDLGVKLSSYVGKRYVKEREWLEAEQIYRGVLKQLDDSKLSAMGMSRGKELPIVNITRPKTNIAIARLQDVQFPSGGNFNFCVNPTPMPEMEDLSTNEAPLPDEMQPEPAPQPEPDPNLPPEAQLTPQPEAPLTVGELAQETMRKARDKAKRMEAQIHDYLVQTDWGKKSRMAMEQMGILGTAVMKAPVMEHRRVKKYTAEQTSDGDTIHMLSPEYEIVPSVQYVDIRTLFPDPGARPGSSIEDIFELHLLTKKEVRDLARNPAFMKNRIRDVLKQDPDPGYIAKTHLLALMGSDSDSIDDRYSVMEYHGPLDKEVAFEMDLITEDEKEDPLVIVQGEVWFVNNTIIRISVAQLEGDDEIPYMFCTWEDDTTSVFGHGIPYLMRHAQRVVASSWIMLLDNAGLTAGPQIVLNKEMIQPANPAEGWSIQPMKVWFMTEYGANVNEAMQFVNVPTQQETIANIIEMGMQFSDIEAAIPAMLGGEAPQGNNTFGGMAMVMTNSHIIQQRHSERWDDNITVPIVEKFYHYEMQYGEKPSLKGDYEVKAGGATERIDKQIKSQDLERIMGMAGSNPEFMAQIDVGEAFREWVATTRTPGILKSREQIEQEAQAAAENPQPDPALIEAQARQMQAEAANKKIEQDQAFKQMEMDLKAQVEEARVDKENREIQARALENQTKLQIEQMKRELELIKMAHERQLKVADIQKELGVAQMSEETKRLLKQADLDKFNTEIAVKREFGEGI